MNSSPKRQNLILVQNESICRRQNNATKKFKLRFQRVENIVGKGENAGYQHFLLFPQYFPKISFPGSCVSDCVVKG